MIWVYVHMGRSISSWKWVSAQVDYVVGTMGGGCGC